MNPTIDIQTRCTFMSPLTWEQLDIMQSCYIDGWKQQEYKNFRLVINTQTGYKVTPHPKNERLIKGLDWGDLDVVFVGQFDNEADIRFRFDYDDTPTSQFTKRLSQMREGVISFQPIKRYRGKLCYFHKQYLDSGSMFLGVKGFHDISPYARPHALMPLQFHRRFRQYVREGYVILNIHDYNALSTYYGTEEPYERHR